MTEPKSDLRTIDVMLSSTKVNININLAIDKLKTVSNSYSNTVYIYI